MDKPKVIQIIPCDGWTVAIGNVGDDKRQQPVAAWGLLDNGEVVPLVPEQWEARLVPVAGRNGTLSRS